MGSSSKVIISLFILKLWIVSVQPIQIKGYTHDDWLFVRGAKSIVEGNWLGEYDDMTLSKGVTGYLFIAIVYRIGISYLLAQQILYFLACISMIQVLKHVIHKKFVLLLCYILLLFNPISYSDAFSFVYRDGLYTILILFFAAFSLGLFFHYKSKMKQVVSYSIAFGITFAAICLCREETVWLYPYVIIGFIIIVGFILGDKECKNRRKRILCILGIPLGILLIYMITIASINNKYYGRFIVNDLTSKEFKDAYGALTRIKQENYIKRVPLNEESREKLSELSPTFRELQSILENDWNKKTYQKTIIQDGKVYEDYQDSFLYWAVRSAVRKLGYYKDATTAEQFYIKLANEINELCDSRKNRKLSKTKFFSWTIS